MAGYDKFTDNELTSLLKDRDHAVHSGAVDHQIPKTTTGISGTLRPHQLLEY
ncbi:MAG: hypothetical protein JWQ63_2855 [Mucilaginibacter sp.]|nr:hypothetical protein [Mucilaginibacter sp.]